MEARKLLALIVCGLIAVVSSGCTVKTVPTEVELDSVETLKPGQEISVTTNKRILIYEGKETFYFDLVITDVNAERIQGNLTS